MRFVFQAEDGIRYLVRSRGLGDVYKRQGWRKVLVLTFKPAVQSAWEDDLRDHVDFAGWQFISPTSELRPDRFQKPVRSADGEKPLICFGSFQDYLGKNCLLYTSDAADERSSVDLGGRRIIKKKKTARDNNSYY